VPALRGWGLDFIALLPQHGLTAQLDLIAFQRQNLHQDLIAFLELVPHRFDTVFRNLANVQQTVRAGENLDERAELG